MLYSSSFTWAMKQAAEKIIFMTKDNQTIKIPIAILPLIPYIHRLTAEDLAILPLKPHIYSLTEHQELNTPISFNSEIMQPIINCITEIKEKLKTRNKLLQDLKKPLLPKDLGDQYIIQEVNDIVKKNFIDASADYIMDTMNASNFLGTEFITNACAQLWVTKQFNVNPQFKHSIEKINAIIKQNTNNLSIQKLIEKHVLLQRPISNSYRAQYGTLICNRELNIADVISLNKLQEYIVCIRLSYWKGFYYGIKNKNLTSIQGFEQIPTYYPSHHDLHKINEENLIINFSDNNLLSIDINPYIFQQFKNLKHLILSKNRFSDINAINIIFPYCIQLIELDLGTNQLTTVSSKTFEQLTQLETLYLDNNQLKELDTLAFQGLEKLRILKLHTNQLKSIDKGILDNLILLKKLDLHNNQLTEIDVELLKALVNLEYLDLSNNMLAYIDPEILKNLKKLKYLTISGNYLTEENIANIKEKLPVNVTIQSLNQKPQITVQKQTTMQAWVGYFSSYYTTLKNKLNEYRKWILPAGTFAGAYALYKYMTEKNK